LLRTSLLFVNDDEFENSPARPGAAETIEGQSLTTSLERVACKQLIILALLGWLAALDDFRNWLIREAA